MSAGWATELDLLRSRGVVLEAGLTPAELTNAEERCGGPLPPDLRSFLGCALPTGSGFPNWRAISDNELERWLAGPFEGIAFDIEHNAFWWPAWGARPAAIERAIAVARQAVEAAPRLIPVFGHRFIPTEPLEAGNPVFSVVQTDIIHYGRDLRDYLALEFAHARYRETINLEPRRIRFWSDLVDWNNQRV